MECKNCGHEFAPFEHFVKLELRFDDVLGCGKLEHLCKNCFFDYALKKLNAKSVQMDYTGRQIKEDDESWEDIFFGEIDDSLSKHLQLVDFWDSLKGGAE